MGEVVAEAVVAEVEECRLSVLSMSRAAEASLSMSTSSSCTAMSSPPVGTSSGEVLVEVAVVDML